MGNIVKYEKFINNVTSKIDDSIVIYGKNNSGKTYLQKEVFKKICEIDIKKDLDNEKMIFTSYLDVNRLETTEAEYVNDNPGLDVSGEYFDRVKKIVSSSNSSLYNYKSARQWVEKNKTESVIDKALKLVFSIETTFSFNDFYNYSDGIKNVVNIISLLLVIRDLVSKKKENIIGLPIILIDEIELYLHVVAQVKFVEYLLSDFADFRFVFTSHSPFLMQRIKNCKMFVLSYDHASLESLDSQYFKNGDDIMDLCFGLNRVPDQLLDFDKYLKKCQKNPNSFSLEKYRRLLEDCRFKNYNFNPLINSMILEFIENIKNSNNLKKGSELYNAIYS